MPEKKSIEELGHNSPGAKTKEQNNNIIVILDDVRSMNNVGSIFRTCDAFAVSELLLCGYTPKPPHRDIHKTALGAEETVPWQHFEDVYESIQYCRQLGYTVFGVEQAHLSTSLEHFAPENRKLALIFGNEVGGVSQAALNMADGCIEIPQWGAKHSLNISVSVGVVLWEFVRNTNLAK